MWALRRQREMRQVADDLLPCPCLRCSVAALPVMLSERTRGRHLRMYGAAEGRQLESPDEVSNPIINSKYTPYEPCNIT
jgi:hypothetical protein